MEDELSSVCLRYARNFFTGKDVRLLEHQGGCSVTVLVAGNDETNRVVQFRPERFRVDSNILEDARRVHGDLVPEIINLDSVQLEGISHQVLEMSWMPGSSFGTLQHRSSKLGPENASKMRLLLSQLAQSFTRSWHCRDESKVSSGRIGKTLNSRLKRLAEELPTDGLREVARAALIRVEAGELLQLPVVLTHGDLLPTNLLVDEETWCLQSIIDWAEAEYLPFGMALYAVDRLLGYLDCCSDGTAQIVYYDEADDLRAYFWQSLLCQLSELSNAALGRATLLARDVGVLLWHGFAWDDGRLDRVIDGVSDGTELAILLSFWSHRAPEQDAQCMERWCLQDMLADAQLDVEGVSHGRSLVMSSQCAGKAAAPQSAAIRSTRVL